MKLPPYRVLAAEDIAAIHRNTIEHLEGTGIIVLHEGALKRLADAGAWVDFNRQHACLQADLVERCLATAPPAFTLAGRDRFRDPGS